MPSTRLYSISVNFADRNHCVKILSRQTNRFELICGLPRQQAPDSRHPLDWFRRIPAEVYPTRPPHANAESTPHSTLYKIQRGGGTSRTPDRNRLLTMAHIYHIPAVVEGSYVDGKRSTHPTVFPKSEVFEGFNAPSRFEGHVLDLEVLGISGAF